MRAHKNGTKHEKAHKLITEVKLKVQQSNKTWSMIWYLYLVQRYTKMITTTVSNNLMENSLMAEKICLINSYLQWCNEIKLQTAVSWDKKLCTTVGGQHCTGTWFLSQQGNNGHCRFSQNVSIHLQHYML